MNEEQPTVPQQSERLQELVNKAFTESPQKAIQEAVASGDNALVDDLQAALSDPKVHDELLQRKKLDPVK